MNIQLINILQNFGLTEKQGEIFIYLYKYGAKPASTVAQAIGGERTNIYKALKKMTLSGVLSEITKRGVKHFFITDKKFFSYKLQYEKKEMESKEKQLPYLENKLEKLEEEKISNKPHISFYEGAGEIQQVFENIYSEIISHKYLSIKMFASNTLDSKSSNKVQNFTGGFFEKLEQEKISIEAYLGNGIMLFENIVKTYDTDILQNLPAGNSAINTFIFGDFVYVIIFKEIPFGIKIENKEFAQMMHFLLKKANLN